MNRRRFMQMGAVGVLALAAPALAKQRDALSPLIRYNGEWDGVWFNWRRIQVDPYGTQQSVYSALVLMGLPPEIRVEVQDYIERDVGVYYTPDDHGLIRPDQRFSAMVSGGAPGAPSREPWVTPRVRPHPLGWSKEKRWADVWRFVDLGFEIWRPHACSNWLYLQTGRTNYIRCRCAPEKGDVCVPTS